MGVLPPSDEASPSRDDDLGAATISVRGFGLGLVRAIALWGGLLVVPPLVPREWWPLASAAAIGWYVAPFILVDHASGRRWLSALLHGRRGRMSRRARARLTSDLVVLAIVLTIGPTLVAVAATGAALSVEALRPLATVRIGYYATQRGALIVGSWFVALGVQALVLAQFDLRAASGAGRHVRQDRRAAAQRSEVSGLTTAVNRASMLRGGNDSQKAATRHALSAPARRRETIAMLALVFVLIAGYYIWSTSDTIAR